MKFIINVKEDGEVGDETISGAITNLVKIVSARINGNEKLKLLDNFTVLKDKIESNKKQSENFVKLLGTNEKVAEKFVLKLAQGTEEEVEEFFYLEGKTLKKEGRKKCILELIKKGVSAEAALELDQVSYIKDEDAEILSKNSEHIARFIKSMAPDTEKSDSQQREVEPETQKNIILEFAKFTSQLENKGDFGTAISRLSRYGNKYAEIIKGIDDKDEQKVILGSLLLLALHDKDFSEEAFDGFEAAIKHYENIKGTNETKSAIIAVVLLSNKEEIKENDGEELRKKISTIAEVVGLVTDPREKFEVASDLFKVSQGKNITNDILKKLTANCDKIDSEKVRSCTKNLSEQSKNINKVIGDIKEDDDKLCFAESLSLSLHHKNFDKEIEAISGNLNSNFNKAIEEAKELTEAKKVGYIYNLIRISGESSGKEAVFETRKEKILKNIGDIDSICANFNSDPTLQKAFYIGLMRSADLGYFPSDSYKIEELEKFFKDEYRQKIEDEKDDIDVVSGESVFFTTYVLSCLEDENEDHNEFKKILVNNIKPKFMGDLFGGINSTLWIKYKDNPKLLKEISSHEEAQTLNEFVKQEGNIKGISPAPEDKKEGRTLDNIIESIVTKDREVDEEYKEKEKAEILKELRYKNLKETIEYLNDRLDEEEEKIDIKDLVQIRRDRKKEVEKGSVKNIMDSFLDLVEGEDEPSKKIKEAQKGMNKDAYESIPKLKSFENRRKQLLEKADKLKDFVLMHKTRAETAYSVLSTLEYYDNEIEEQNTAEEPDKEYLKYLKKAKKEYINKMYNGKKEKGEEWELGRQAINKQKRKNGYVIGFSIAVGGGVAAAAVAATSGVAAAIIIAVVFCMIDIAGIVMFTDNNGLVLDKESLLKLQAEHDVKKSNNILRTATGNIINEKTGKLEKTEMVDEKTKIKTSKSEFGKLNLTVDKGETAIKKITTSYYKEADKEGAAILKTLENIKSGESRVSAISGMLNRQSNIFKRGNQRQ